MNELSGDSVSEVNDDKPSLDDVRELIAMMVERSRHGWTGEGDEIATELLNYINGRNPNALAEWKIGMEDWVYIVEPGNPGQTRGPFNSQREAREILASMPEHATAVSKFGRTSDRANYVVMGWKEYARQKASRV